MISSVPYVPPDAIKKVAATRGQSVSFATLFLVMGIAREGNCAGTDMELNSYSCPPERSSLSRCGEASPQVQNTIVFPACKRKMHFEFNFFCFNTKAFAACALCGHTPPKSCAPCWDAVSKDRPRPGCSSMFAAEAQCGEDMRVRPHAVKGLGCERSQGSA